MSNQRWSLPLGQGHSECGRWWTKGTLAHRKLAEHQLCCPAILPFFLCTKAVGCESAEFVQIGGATHCLLLVWWVASFPEDNWMTWAPWAPTLFETLRTIGKWQIKSNLPIYEMFGVRNLITAEATVYAITSNLYSFSPSFSSPYVCTPFFMKYKFTRVFVIPSG